LGRDLVIEDPLLGLGDRHRFGEHVVHLDHFDAAVAHLLHEIEVIALGGLDPDHVVEQQPVVVRRRQALVRASRRADHHEAQLADFRVDTKGGVLISHNKGSLAASFEAGRRRGSAWPARCFSSFRS
jgi:hypothetical protein